MSVQTTSRPLASVIIPAYNEASVIARCLDRLLSHARPGEFEIIVVCNGCVDDTAEVARKFEPKVRVIELAEASKTAALNAGDHAASVFPRLYLDGDLCVETSAARALVRQLRDSRKLAAVGNMVPEYSRCSPFVRAFYRVWFLHPYFDGGKFGGLFALSQTGHERIGEFAKVTNDDEFIRRQFATKEVAYVPECCFRVEPPRTIASLVRVRARVRRGNRALSEMSGTKLRRRGEGKMFLLRILPRVHLWPLFAVYASINLVADISCALRRAQAGDVWERDDTARVDPVKS